MRRVWTLNSNLTIESTLKLKKEKIVDNLIQTYFLRIF